MELVRTEKVDYSEITALRDYYFEDSYLFDLFERDDQFEWIVEAVLSKSHPQSGSLKEGEKYDYRFISITFPHVRETFWKKRVFQRVPAVGADYPDFGNIDTLYRTGNRYHADGDWGSVDFDADDPVVKVLERYP